MKYRYHEMSIIQASGQTLVKRETHLFLCVKKKKNPSAILKEILRTRLNQTVFPEITKLTKLIE